MATVGTGIAKALRVIQKPAITKPVSVRSESEGYRRGALTESFGGLFRRVASLLLLGFLFLNLSHSFSANLQMSDANPLALPEVGAYGLRVLTPTVLELTFVNSKEPDPARVTSWDFVGDDFSFVPPTASQFLVSANGQSLGIRNVSFKRRVLSATMKQRDLRIGNYLYLELTSAIGDGQTVEVKNPPGDLWPSTTKYTAVADPLRFNPALHVNQTGYMPSYPKKAMIGYYIGSGGELKIPYPNGFKLLDANTGAVVFQGTLTSRLDQGYSYSPTPYQQVYQADFSAFQTPGEYRLQVPGMGTSYSFLINEGTAALYARTFALGLYHQRCGMADAMPFTRFTHDACHTALADIPTMEFSTTQAQIASKSADYSDFPRHTAPQLKDVDSSLYPFVLQGKINVSGGHHDAGDYSKYTINSAGLIHFLTFAADSFPGAGALDNLGIPESGDGKSDLLQEAKWEADFLAKMQDADGGFYFLVYPRDREYENDVLPDHGDPQVVWPKTTAVTAAAAAALAEIGSSPLFKKQFPAESAIYLQKAQLGWTFLINAIAKYGKDGSYQKITHYGNEFMHDDELAWAASAMFAATGNPLYFSKLKEWYPNPNDPSTRRWTWWRMFEGYGNAIRTYAFAAKSGRLLPAQLDPTYLSQCQTEIIATADDVAHFSQESSYGTSFGDPYKSYRNAGWYFSSERGFDLTVGFQINPKPAYSEALIANINYEGGCNPVNTPYITGMGFRRQRDIVHQYAQNDRRILPPSGLPQGNMQAGFQGDLYFYKGELTELSYPPDNAVTAPYPYYDRWADSYNTMTEFVVVDQARSLASLSFWMARSSVASQPWKPAAGIISNLPSQLPADATATVQLTASGIDLSSATTVWESLDLDPALGNSWSYAPKYPGEHWIEAEALLPDGRRIFAVSNFVATTATSALPNAYQSVPVSPVAETAAVYHLDADLTDATRKQSALPLSGNARLDANNLGWMAQRSGTALRVLDLGDKATVQIPVSTLKNAQTTSIRLEAMIYVNGFKAYNRDTVHLISLRANSSAYLELMEDKYRGPFIRGGTTFSFSGPGLTSTLTPKTWHHLSIDVNKSGYTFRLDGVLLATMPSTEFNTWSNSQSATLELGNFDGWIDEVVVRNIIAPIAAMPVVTLTSPASGLNSFIPASISIAAAARTGAGSISKVEFFANALKIGQSTTSPYSFTWNNPSAGSYALTAKATDSAGVMGISAPVNINVSAVGQAATPQISPNGGIFNGQVIVSLISATSGSTIRYTTDGSEPTANSDVYPGSLSFRSSLVLKAKAFKFGLVDSATSMASFTVNPSIASNQATFVGADTTTQGNWPNAYGKEGYQLFGDVVNIPSYCTLQASGAQQYIWTQSTADPRAVLLPNSTDRLAIAWYSNSGFSLDMGLTDGNKHRISLYFVDWDRVGRAESIEVVDATSGIALDTQTLTNFGEGKYLTWDIRGHVTFRFTTQRGPNTVVMAAFIDSAPSTDHAVLKPLGRSSVGGFRLQVNGTIGKDYLIEASADSRNWVEVGTISLPLGSAEFTDTSATGQYRLYRATLLN